MSKRDFHKLIVASIFTPSFSQLYSSPAPSGLCRTMMLSSSVDVPSPGGLSAVSTRNVFRSSSISGAMYNLEKSPSSTGPDATGLAGNKKRRSSLGAKMVAIVGLSQWSKSTLQLNQQGGRVLNTPATLLFSVRCACCFLHLCLLSLSQPEQFHAMVCHFWCVLFLTSFIFAFLHLSSTFLSLFDFQGFIRL